MRKTVDPEFAAYVDARQDRWLRAAYLVYGDLERAEERLLHAFTRLSLRWGRTDDPDLYVQRLLYQSAASRWSRASAYGLGQDDEGAGETVRVALGGLSPTQRAVLVLLFFEQLNLSETSEVLGLSPGTVQGLCKTALSRFGTRLQVSGTDRATGRLRDHSHPERS